MILVPSTLALIASSASVPDAPFPRASSLAESAALAPFLVVPVQDEKKAADFSYTYIEAGYYSTDVDSIDESSDAVFARGSLGLFDFLYVFATYANESLDAVGGEVDSDQWGLGVGAHFGVAPKLDLVGEAAWLYADLSSDEFSDLNDTNNGWMAFAGARWMPLPWEGGGLEANGGFRWYDLQGIGSDDETGAWEAGARVHLLKLFSVGGTYQFLEDDSRYAFDLRVSF